MTSTAAASVADRFQWGIDLHDSELLALIRSPYTGEINLTLDMATVMREATPDARLKYDPAEILDAAELTFTGVDWSSDLDEDPCSDSWMIANCHAEPGVGGAVNFTFELIASVGTPQVAWGKFAVTAHDFLLSPAKWRSFKEGDDPARAIALLESPGTPGYRKAQRVLCQKSQLPALEAALSDPHCSDGIKLAICDIFHRTRWIESVPVLESLLDVTDTKLRAQAIAALGNIRNAPSGPRLLELLSSSGEPDAVRSEAALALGNLRYKPAIDVLKAALRDDSARMRTTASRALKLLQ